MSSSRSMGLLMKSSQPAWIPLIRSSRSCRAVTMTIGTSRVVSLPLSRRQTSKPSIPGIMTSRRMTSGRRSQTLSIACWPEEAFSTVQPWGVSIFSMTRRFVVSSSTARMCSGSANFGRFRFSMGHVLKDSPGRVNAREDGI